MATEKQSDTVSMAAESTTTDTVSLVSGATSLKLAQLLGAIETQKWLKARKDALKPWSVFFQLKRFKCPKTGKYVAKRFMTNTELFLSNYICVFMFLVMYCVMTSPLLLVALLCIGAIGYYLRMRTTNGARLFGRPIGVKEQYAVLGLISIPILWLVGASSAIFWIVGASCVCIALHAVMYRTDAELDEAQLLEFPDPAGVDTV